MRRGLISLIAFAASVACGDAQACEPVWVRPVDLSGYAVAGVGAVEQVDWLRGRIRVVSLKRLRGTPIGTFDINFNNIPLTCGWQFFQANDEVYFFINRSPSFSWAALLRDVTFQGW
jgi:hypothetical protein